MTREEAINEINKVFEPAFANYIITALTEGATVSDKEPTTKNDLGVDREDAVEKLNALKQFIGYDKGSEIVKATQKSLDIAIKALEQEPILDKICNEIERKASSGQWSDATIYGMKKCLTIIEKYRGKEVADGNCD